jgi:hypothetical protein
VQHQQRALQLLVLPQVPLPRPSSPQLSLAPLSLVILLAACSDSSLLLPLPLLFKQREDKGMVSSISLYRGTLGYDGRDPGDLILGFIGQETSVQNLNRPLGCTDMDNGINKYLCFLY